MLKQQEQEIKKDEKKGATINPLVLDNIKKDTAPKTNPNLNIDPHSHAERFGRYVDIATMTAHAGEKLPNPIINNEFEDSDSNSEDNHLMLVNGHYYSIKIVSGTTAQWFDYEKVANDAKKEGNYSEYVLVCFPDGSTYKTWTMLNVLPEEAKTRSEVRK